MLSFPACEADKAVGFDAFFGLLATMSADLPDGAMVVRLDLRPRIRWLRLSSAMLEILPSHELRCESIPPKRGDPLVDYRVSYRRM